MAFVWSECKAARFSEPLHCTEENGKPDAPAAYTCYPLDMRRFGRSGEETDFASAGNQIPVGKRL
jgi:hypothetical protein